MIEHLRGHLLAKSPAHVVVDAGGVGYGADISSATARTLGPVGAPVALHVVTIVREESIRLVAFTEEAERDVFEAMLDVPRVGPSIALSALSALGWERLVAAVADRDVKLLSSIPGVGRKTAERLAIDLETKLKPFAQAVAARGIVAGGGSGTPAGAAPGSAAGTAPPDATPIVSEAIAALEALGCKPAVARRAVERAIEVVGRDVAVADLIRESLRHRY